MPLYSKLILYLGGMENGIGRPKRPEPKEDDLGFDPSQFALDQLDITRNKLNDMNLNPRQPNKPRLVRSQWLLMTS